MAGLGAAFAILAAARPRGGLRGAGPLPFARARAPPKRPMPRMPEERKPTPQPDDPALAGEIDRLLAAGRAGRRRVRLGAAGGAGRRRGRAGAAGSDAWIEAQQALSRLESARARTTAALADLDRLAVERTSAGTLGEGDSERLAPATAEMQALADSQADRLQRLGESLIRL